MRRNRALALVGAAAATGGLVLGGCSEAAESDVAGAESATVATVDGADLPRLTLTARAVERLDLRTGLVEARPTADRPRKIIPYAAVLYDAEGATWVYTTPESLVYERVAVTIEHVDGDSAVLADGPTVGTRVVTLGAVELFGTELGVGK